MKSCKIDTTCHDERFDPTDYKQPLFGDGALPQTPVHSFLRQKERNQEKAPRVIA